MPSPKTIGIGLVMAAAAGLVPGVPGVIGGGPSEDSAGALPLAPDVVEVLDDGPVGPDDGLTRLIVTPAISGSEASENEASPSAPDSPDLDVAEEAVTPPESLRPPRQRRPRAPEAEPPASADLDERRIDPALIAELTSDGVLEFDRQGRPWALFRDGTRVPMFHGGGGAEILAGRRDRAESATESAATEPAQAEPAVTEAAVTEPLDEADAMVGHSLGNETMDLIAELDGVVEVVALGDGTYAVALEDPSVLDGFDVTFAIDEPLGIGGDPYEPFQWALENNGDNLATVELNPRPAMAADADIDGSDRGGMSGAGVVVAVVDSGVDFSHSDLAAAQWLNEGEDCTNGVDDDANGYVDDCHGWDFAYGDDEPFNDGANAHGTHVAGIIAAAADGQGIVGVAPGVDIMDLNVGTKTASGAPGITTSAVARAIRYATDNGADVINLSLGGAPGAPRASAGAIENAIAHAESEGVVVVAAAGNNGVDLDAAPVWPASFEMSNMITVGASSPTDTRATFSNWGTALDLFAPGEMIISTAPRAQGRFLFMSGTSQATPIVAAAAALVLDRSPLLPPDKVRERLVAAADRLQALVGHVGGGARLNVANAVGGGTPRIGLTDVAVTLSGLADLADGDPIDAVVDIAVPTPADGEDDLHEGTSWHLSLVADTTDGRFAIVDHEVRVDGRSQQTDRRGSVDLGIEGSGTVTLSTELPHGAYVLALESVDRDDPDMRIGEAKLARFTVGGGTGPEATSPVEMDPPGGSQADDPASGSGPDSADSSGDGGGAGSDTETGGRETGAQAGTAAAARPGASGTGDAGSAASGGADGSGSDRGPSAGVSSGTGDPDDDSESPASAPVNPPEDDPAPTRDPGGEPVRPRTDPDEPRPSAGPASSRPAGSQHRTPSPTAPEPAEPVASDGWAIDSLSPHSGPIGERTLVQISGRFPEETYVWFGDAVATVVTATGRVMLVEAPLSMKPGTVDVSLRRTGSGTVLTMPGAFTYLATDAANPDSSAPRTETPQGPEAEDPARDSSGPEIKQRRAVVGDAIVELGRGLSGAALQQPDGLRRAVACTTDPCRI